MKSLCSSVSWGLLFLLLVDFIGVSVLCLRSNAVIQHGPQVYSCSSFWMILSQTLAVSKRVPITFLIVGIQSYPYPLILTKLMHFYRHSLPERQLLTHHLHGRIAHLFVVEVWCLNGGTSCCANSVFFSLHSHSLVQIIQGELLWCLKVNKSNISREDETVCIVVCGDIWCSSEWNKKHQQGNWGIIKLTIPKILPLCDAVWFEASHQIEAGPCSAGTDDAVHLFYYCGIFSLLWLMNDNSPQVSCYIFSPLQ